MLSEKDLAKIKKTTREFFEKMGFLVEVKDLDQKQKTIFVNLKSEEPRVLIGKNGEVLAGVQRLLGSILKRKVSQPVFFNFDINEYKKKKTDYLKETARALADRVALTKKEKVLDPMPSYERRIIHLELADRSDVTTQSVGEGPERRVVIKPYP